MHFDGIRVGYGNFAYVGSSSPVLLEHLSGASETVDLKQSNLERHYMSTGAGTNVINVGTVADDGYVKGQSFWVTRQSSSGTLTVEFPTGTTINVTTSGPSSRAIGSGSTVIYTHYGGNQWIERTI